MAEVERCWRCSAEMEWRHGTWQCSLCRLKLGCCEGEPQSCDVPSAEFVTSAVSPFRREPERSISTQAAKEAEVVSTLSATEQEKLNGLLRRVMLAAERWEQGG